MTNLVPFRGDQLAPATLDVSATGNAWIDLVAPAAELAKMIAATEFVPAEMRNKPAAVTACVLYGAEIGIGPMQALAKIDIVKGRPAPRAELARALALAAGHEVWVEKSTNTSVTVSGRRRNSDHVMTVTWTMDDAKRAGIAGQQYQKYPRQMLLARASAELVRQLCPDALGGITLFAEEAEDAFNDGLTAAPAPTSDTAPAKTTTTRRRGQPALAAAPQTEPDTATEPPLPGEDDQIELATDMQVKKLIIGFNAQSISKREDRLEIICAVIGRTVASSKDCTKDEASKVIDTLDRIADGALELRYADGQIVIAPAEAADDSSDTSDLPPLPFEDE
jgi:hypothetical protein